jgi:hypothetical protein
MPTRIVPLSVIVFLLVTLDTQSSAAEPPTAPIGVPVTYQLPTDGPLPKTYRVTLAAVDPKNPDWIVAQFARGIVRTVTAENGGKFNETWDGLDDNHMPVPPGTYGVKGIVMPARKWDVDGEYHSVTPKYLTGASSWHPPAGEGHKGEPFGGDPVGSPLRDVAVGPNGVAVFYYQYLENGTNNPMVDLKKPVGPEQFLRAFPSGGAGGGPCATTDGETVWAFSADGGPKYVYRADGKAFGKSPGANRTNSYPPEGWVTSMAVWKEKPGGKTIVFVAQRGKIDSEVKGTGAKRKPRYTESDEEFVDKVTAHDGDTGKVLAEIPVARPRGLAVRGAELFALYAEGDGFAVGSVPLDAGLPKGQWKKAFAVPKTIVPADMEVDSRGRVYLSDTKANKVYQLDAAGKALRSYGKLAAQKPGSYDPDTFMSPAKLATWVDAEGNDRLLVVENGGPNRVSEWSADGVRLRDFLNLQTHANDGYAVDPEHPDHVYIPGHEGWLTRFKVDYTKGTWSVEAVWPEVGTDQRSPGVKKPVFVRANGNAYLACGRSYNVYRLAGDRWLLSAALIQVRGEGKTPTTYSAWNDTNGNGRIDDDDEVRPIDSPPGVFTYHGQNWLGDLSMLAIGVGSRDVWRIAPSGYDPHGNPIFKEWKKTITDPVFEARLAGKADAIHGGNEMADRYTSDWSQVDGSVADGFFVQARGGKNFSANEGAQHTISRYISDGTGGYKLKWRTGRTALERIAQPGEMYGGMRIRRPINGLLSVIDQSRCGVLLYTEDGLYVDTIFPDGRTVGKSAVGLYRQGGEFFAGVLYPHKDTGKIYLGFGKYTPLIYEAEGWSVAENPAKPLTTLPQTVSIAASQIASPPEIALSLRGGAGVAKVARFSPALGGAALDGSLTGWESCEPIRFTADKDHTVEVRCLYDPDHLYLRWHARLGAKLDVKPLPRPERVFAHDREADTLSFYIQGDAAAKSGGPNGGRPGDARYVFSLAKDGDAIKPVAIGMYPEWTAAGASPQVYRTPVGEAVFAHVGPVAGAKLGHALDPDGKGFVIVAVIPREAVPRQAKPFAGGWRTLVNYEATFGGSNKFWWANSDGSASREALDEPTEARLYPGSWAPAQFGGIEGGVTVRNWLICGPFGGHGAEKFKADPNGKMPGTDKDMKKAVQEFCEAAKYPPDDGGVDPSAEFKGDLIRGYWPDPKAVKWKAATVADLDSRVVLGLGGQVWYGATWVHAPVATELSVRYQGHAQTTLRWTVNGESVKLGKPTGDGEHRRQDFAAKLPVKAGWNEVRVRGYCTGYAPFRAGLVLDGPTNTLWGIKLATSPPTK